MSFVVNVDCGKCTQYNRKTFIFFYIFFYIEVPIDIVVC